MNITKITGANTAKIYAETNKKLNSDKINETEKQVKPGDTVHEKTGVGISREAKSMNFLDFAKGRIKTDMNDTANDISADKINQLMNSVQSGDYRIGTEALVSAIINGKPQL
jgi:anti-sigma28 factor (negative regulator of flagellin synthesis)